MREASTALIIGAGVGGLAAAIALRRAGWNVRVYERASHPRELGFGLVLAANALSALRELGVAAAIVSAGVSTRQVEIRRVDGQVIKRFSRQLAGPTLVALRSVLHGALLSAVGDAALRLGREVVSYDVLEAGVRVRFQDGGIETGAVLVGADGVSSVVRKQLHPREPPPRPSGFCSLGGVAYGVGDSLGELGGVAYLDAGIEAGTLRASGDAVYWYFSLLVNDLLEALQRDPHRPLRADATV